jgi:pimeloyl-ACP methyl ester carboxylesterase
LFKTFLLFFLLTFQIIVHAASYSDLFKEQKYEKIIEESLVVGEILPLQAEQKRFIGIYTEANQAKPDGAIILLHGMGAHPNWNDIILPIRTYFPDHGWSTLSIQLPVKNNRANKTDYLPLFDLADKRIQSAVSFLQKKDIKYIAIIGHSLGAIMGMYYLAQVDSTLPKEEERPIFSMMAIGLNVISKEKKYNTLQFIKEISIPVYDIYGDADLAGVLRSAKSRHNKARQAGNRNYKQIKINGANHFFYGKEKNLIKRVFGWNRNQFLAKKAANKIKEQREHHIKKAQEAERLNLK